MKKIISINLAGKSFQIEEDACEYLQRALQQNNSEAEAKIAEEFDRLINDRKTFVTYPDAVEVIHRLGYEVEGQSTPRRLYRRSDDKVFAGVCSGIGDYLNIDPVIVRVLFVLLAILGTVGLWFYIILWIIIPAAPKTLPGRRP